MQNILIELTSCRKTENLKQSSKNKKVLDKRTVI